METFEVVKTEQYEYYMRLALVEAEKAGALGEVPVGAVIVKNGKVIATAHNEKELRASATAHAEVLAIERAGAALGRWYLDGCEMFVTLEPCAMCAGALINSRMERVVFGTHDVRFGACGTLYNLPCDTRFNHTLDVVGGCLQDECVAILQSFFKRLRARGKKKKQDAVQSVQERPMARSEPSGKG